MPRPRPSLKKQQEQQFTAAVRRMDPLELRVFTGLTELFVRDGIAGWVRLRTALDLGIQAHARATTKKGTR